MIRLIIQHLHFTRTERYGVAVLLALCLIVYLAPSFWRGPERQSDFSEFRESIRHFRQQAVDTMPPAASELFAFDPNTADENTLRRLGLPEKTLNSILHYREKGGQFRKPEDLEKIYTLDPDDYQRLKSFIRIENRGEQARFVHFREDDETWNRNNYERRDRPEKRSKTVDVNRSEAADWVQLPGIGEKRAAQILHFREALGGFLSVEQVAETFNLPDSVFQKIRPFLVHENDQIKKINLNTAFSEEIDRHPYVSEKQAKLIVHYREQHGAYRSIDDLKNIIPFKDPSWLEKVRPYFTVE